MNEDDLEISTGCAVAHPNQRGGQHVAQQCTAVLVMHKPTGIGVRVNERSQHRSRMIATAKLISILDAIGYFDDEEKL